MNSRAEVLDEQIKNELNRIADKTPAEESKESDIIPEKEVIKEVTDPFLEEALKMGYDPNFKGDNKKSAEQFVKDGSFFKKIADLKKDNEEVKKLVRQLAEHNAKLEKVTLEKEFNELHRQKMEAVSQADGAKVIAIENQQLQINKQMQEVIVPVIKPEYTQELLDFQERNKDWFNNQSDENAEMAEAADYIDKRIGRQLAEKGQRISQSEHLKMVEDKIKKLYPHRFSNENQKRADMVATSTVGSGEITSKDLSSKLTKQQKDFVKKARDYGSKLTEKEYARQLEKTGELRNE